MSRRKKAIIVIAALFLFCVIGALSVYFLWSGGYIRINHPEKKGYTVKGVDVSGYQGEIDWAVLSSQGIDFAFIKATEGSVHTDEFLERNMKNSGNTGLRTGYYHFFSFESKGATQAENYISHVPAFPGMLPPVIDVELYGRFREQPLDRETVRSELADMIGALKENYGCDPIIYTTQSTYDKYFEGDPPDCDLWLRNVYREPAGDWTFWQYDAHTVLDGYRGEEKFIDMNVFRGTKEEFENYNTVEVSQ